MTSSSALVWVEGAETPLTLICKAGVFSWLVPSVHPPGLYGSPDRPNCRPPAEPCGRTCVGSLRTAGQTWMKSHQRPGKEVESWAGPEQ